MKVDSQENYTKRKIVISNRADSCNVQLLNEKDEIKDNSDKTTFTFDLEV